MAPNADLYLGKIDLERYCAGDTCELCKVNSFQEMVEKIKAGNVSSGICPHWPQSKVERFRAAAQAGEYLPTIPTIDTPRPFEPGLTEINNAGESSSVLVTGNSEFSVEVMMAVLATTAAPLKLLSVDTLGHTVDMAMVYKTLTAAKTAEALENASIKKGESGPRIILPGLAADIVDELKSLFGSGVEAGPICAAELPLYMGDDWVAVP